MKWIKENIKWVSVFAGIGAIIGFVLGVYVDVMRIDDLENEILRNRKQIDKLIELEMQQMEAKALNETNAKEIR